MLEQYNQLVSEGKYPSRKEWFSRYGRHGHEVAMLLDSKKHSLHTIPLHTVEGSFYYNESFIIPIVKSYFDNHGDLDDIHELPFDSFENNLIFSEVEGSLEIEGIKTSRKKIEDVLNKKEPLNSKEQVILNMKNGVDFIRDHPINTENMYKLYQILSDKCLSEDEQIEGIYRKRDVDVIGIYGEISDHGAPAGNLEVWMSEFVALIQSSMNQLNPLTYLMPHIIHYYLITLHPYYDFNGRMARMLSYWYCQRCPYYHDPLPVFSEAINYNRTTKSQYYKAIENSRSDDNDLSYFLEYIFSVSSRFVKVYRQLGLTTNQLRKKGVDMNPSEINLLKPILLYYKDEDQFNWEDVSRIDKQQYSKQYYLRILNRLSDMDILSKELIKNKTVYRLKKF